MDEGTSGVDLQPGRRTASPAESWASIRKHEMAARRPNAVGLTNFCHYGESRNPGK